MKDKKVFIFGTIIIILFLIISKSFCQITGKVYQVIDECDDERPVVIMKALGVKHINGIKKSYDSDVITDWKINVDNNKIIELEYTNPVYSTGDNWNLMGDSYKKINEIDSTIKDDNYAYYYNQRSDYVTNLEETKIIKFDDIKHKSDNTSLNIFEKSSGMSAYYLPFIIMFIVLFIIIFKINKSKKRKIEKHNAFLKENNALYVLKNIEYDFGIDNFIQGELCNIFIQSDNLKIVNLKSNSTASLKYSQIIACGNFTDEDIQKQSVTKNGSVVGRGALAGFVFGPAGLILGGLSGIGAKKETVEFKTYSFHFIINYKAKNSKEVKSISFKSNKRRSDFYELENQIKKHFTKQNIDL